MHLHLVVGRPRGGGKPQYVVVSREHRQFTVNRHFSDNRNRGRRASPHGAREGNRSTWRWRRNSSGSASNGTSPARGWIRTTPSNGSGAIHGSPTSKTAA